MSRVFSAPSHTGLFCLVVGAFLGSTVPAPATGAIEGAVTYLGQPPEPLPIMLTNGEMRFVDVNSGNAGLRSAVVSVADAAAVPAPASLPVVTIEQRNYLFIPMIVAVREGQPVRFTNDDPANHSVRSTDRFVPNRFSIYTGTKQDYRHSFKVSPNGRPVVIGCDIHDWMAGWIYVFNHPLFALTAADGHFAIAAVPPGKHTIAVRHPGGNLRRDVDVIVQAGKPTHVDVVFTAGELGSPIQ